MAETEGISADEQMEAYTEAVKSGLYAKKTGLIGKYDNVRLYWEDEITRMRLRPHVQELIERVESDMRRIRILDLGCGSADGYELLTGIRKRDADLKNTEIDLLTPDKVGLYKGVDLNPDLGQQMQDLYGSDGKMVFEKGDFTDGLPLAVGDKPFDLYFSSYGTCSHHNDDRTLVRLLAEIAEHTETRSLVVCDWLGRYSYEWQSLWTHDLAEHRNLDYVVSYIYEEEERELRRDELQHLWLRLMTRREAEQMIAEASRLAGVEIRILDFFDRSVFTGRHMDTREYNQYAQPIRAAVNSLHEVNMRTDLSTLLINYVPKQGYDFLNEYYEHLQMCWNTLVHYVDDLLQSYDGDQRCFAPEPPPIPASYPAALQEVMLRMRQVVEGVGWLGKQGLGLPRENIIEPQMGYALRGLVTKLQKGEGCGHGLGAILKIEK